MNKLASIALLLTSTLAFGQTDIQLKLIDSFSYETLELDSTLKIKHAKFSIDTVTDIITISRIRGKRLKIEFPNYDFYSNKERIKKYKGGIVTRQLVPNDSLIEKKFREIWDSPNISTDTLSFKDQSDLKKYVLSYLNYLVVLADSCDNGMCNFSNTYNYEIEFIESNSIFEISSIERTGKSSYKCEVIYQYIKRLNIIFPKTKLDAKPEEPIVFRIRMML